MLRDDVALHLRAGIDEARQKEMGILLESIQVFRPGPHIISVAVTPLSVAGLGRQFLISFEDASHPGSGPAVPNPSQVAEVNGEDQGDPQRRIAQLEAELASTRRYLQSIIEELRSANEEAQSSNEELQSSNEELQTAKEELQASYEELQTLNAEMDSRNADLKQLSDDLLNLLTSLQTPILTLDSSLRIRRFTQASEKLLKLIATDIGRPISDLKPRINVTAL
jgi:two-component system CheB/CheR fusion protein